MVSVGEDYGMDGVLFWDGKAETDVDLIGSAQLAGMMGWDGMDGGEKAQG